MSLPAVRKRLPILPSSKLSSDFSVFDMEALNIREAFHSGWAFQRKETSKPSIRSHKWLFHKRLLSDGLFVPTGLAWHRLPALVQLAMHLPYQGRLAFILIHSDFCNGTATYPWCLLPAWARHEEHLGVLLSWKNLICKLGKDVTQQLLRQCFLPCIMFHYTDIKCFLQNWI